MSDTAGHVSLHDFTWEFAGYCCVLMDVMGHSQELEKWRQIHLHEATPDGLQKLATPTKTIADLRTLLKKYASRFSDKQTTYSLFSKVPESVASILSRLSPPTLYTQSFGDTVLLFCRVKDPNTDFWALPSIAACIYSAASTYREFLANGIPLRGAIEIGAGVQYPEGDLGGLVLSDAHYLECTFADYPRVIAGPKLGNLLTRMPEHSTTPVEHSKAYSWLSEWLLSTLFAEDEPLAEASTHINSCQCRHCLLSKFCTIDFLDCRFLQHHASESPFPLLCQAIGMRERHATNAKLVGKYTRLIEFISDRIVTDAYRPYADDSPNYS